jgi:hypothetical protein
MNIMLLTFRDLENCLRSLILSFWLVQNLSSLLESRKHLGPTSGSDNYWNGVSYE